MSLFFNNDGESLYGAMRATLKQTAVGAEALGPPFGVPEYVYVWVYTCTSSGTLTLVGSGQATFEEAGNVTVPVVVAADAAVPSGGGIVARANLANNATGAVTCYSPTGYASVGAGTHNVTVKVVYEAGEDEYHVAYGGGVTYAPDALVKSGPWSYDFELPNIFTAAFEAACGFSATLAAAHALDADFAAVSGFDATATGAVLEGPWDYDFELPALPDLAAAFDAVAAFEAAIDPYRTIATGVEGATYTDADVLGGVTYRYRVTDSLGNVVYSNEVTFSPDVAAAFEAVAGFEAALTGQTPSTPIASEFAAEVAFAATLAKQAAIDAEFAAIVRFEAAASRYVPVPPFALRVTATDAPTLRVSGDGGPTLQVGHAAGPRLEVEGY